MTYITGTEGALVFDKGQVPRIPGPGGA